MDFDIEPFRVEGREEDAEVKASDLDVAEGILANLLLRYWSKKAEKSLDKGAETSPYVTHDGEQDAA